MSQWSSICSRVRSKQTFLPGCRLRDFSERTKDRPKNESFYNDLQHCRYKSNTHIYVQVLAREHTRLPFKSPTLHEDDRTIGEFKKN